MRNVKYNIIENLCQRKYLKKYFSELRNILATYIQIKNNKVDYAAFEKILEETKNLTN